MANGRYTAGEPGGKAVGTSSTALLEENKKRGKISFYNPNTYAVWLAAGVDALLNKGAWLSPGGSLDINDPDEARLAWNGIAASSNDIAWLAFMKP